MGFPGLPCSVGLAGLEMLETAPCDFLDFDNNGSGFDRSHNSTDLHNMKLLIINGPNLDLLGHREPEIYGTESMEHFLERLINIYPDITIDYYQSNHEGDIIEMIHDAGEYDGIVLNAGAYTHTSLAIADAIRSISTEVIEVHISNTQAREEVRHHSLIGAACKGVIAGMGMDSYRLAVEYFINHKG